MSTKILQTDIILWPILYLSNTQNINIINQSLSSVKASFFIVCKTIFQQQRV